MDKDEGHQFENEIRRDRVNQRCYEFLKKTHQAIIDSIHPTAIGGQRDFFKNILQERADGLLFSEETMNFYQYNLRIKPKQLKLGISYLMKVMNILLNYNQA